MKRKGVQAFFFVRNLLQYVSYIWIRNTDIQGASKNSVQGTLVIAAKSLQDAGESMEDYWARNGITSAKDDLVRVVILATLCFAACDGMKSVWEK